MDTPDKAAVGAVVAVKPFLDAKSRLTSLPQPLRRQLAWTMAVDTLLALSSAVDRVVVVSRQPALESRLRRLGVSVTVLDEPGVAGLNAALSHGADHLRSVGCPSVVACVGDLPALRRDSVRQVLAASQANPRTFLADASGVGTTLLVAHGTALLPRFEGPSAAAHQASGAVPLDPPQLTVPVPDARRDVDTEADLLEAFRLGLGATTAALFDPETSELGRFEAITVRRSAGTRDMDAIASTGFRLLLPFSALQEGLRRVHSGQRLHAVVSKDRVLAAWL